MSCTALTYLSAVCGPNPRLRLDGTPADPCLTRRVHASGMVEVAVGRCPEVEIGAPAKEKPSVVSDNEVPVLPLVGLGLDFASDPPALLPIDPRFVEPQFGGNCLDGSGRAYKWVGSRIHFQCSCIVI